jgi:hypothetical protein
VGFPGTDYSMVDDVTLAYWNQNATSPYLGDPPGSWCYVEDGRRFSLGAWPRAPLLPTPGALTTAACDT